MKKFIALILVLSLLAGALICFASCDGKKDTGVAGGIPFGKWVNVGIEVHKIVEEVEDPKTGLVSTEYTPKIKVFVDGKYQGECDANITGGGIYYNRNIC